MHVVLAEESTAGLARYDDSTLAPLAIATQGMAAMLGPADAEHEIDASMLVRPITLDAVTIKAPGWEPLSTSTESSCDELPSEQLGEGLGCTWWGRGDASAGSVVVEGLLWNRRIVRVLRPDPSHARNVARDLSMIGQFDETLLRRVDAAAHGLRGAWAMYVSWGSTTGSYDSGMGRGSSGWCCGHFTTVGHTVGVGTIGTIGSSRNVVDLRGQLEPLISRCQLGPHKARAKVEMTGLEIIDVRVTLDSAAPIGPSQRDAIEHCIEDTLWEASPMLPQPTYHSTYNVAFGPR